MLVPDFVVCLLVYILLGLEPVAWLLPLVFAVVVSEKLERAWAVLGLLYFPILFHVPRPLSFVSLFCMICVWLWFLCLPCLVLFCFPCLFVVVLFVPVYLGWFWLLHVGVRSVRLFRMSARHLLFLFGTSVFSPAIL